MTDLLPRVVTLCLGNPFCFMPSRPGSCCLTQQEQLYPIAAKVSLANNIVILGLMLGVNATRASRNPKRAACRMGRAAVMNVVRNPEPLIECGFNGIFH